MALGFDVDCRLRADCVVEPFLDALIAFIEARGLLLGGPCGSGELDIWVCGEERDVTDADRHALWLWLKSRPEVQGVGIGPIEPDLP
jgi:uncharacterized protein YggL (DUF469 family)